MATESDTFESPFDPGRRDVTLECPEGKKLLGGGWALYSTRDGFADFWAPADRVQAFPQIVAGTDRYTVTTYGAPQPNYIGLKLTATGRLWLRRVLTGRWAPASGTPGQEPSDLVTRLR